MFNKSGASADEVTDFRAELQDDKKTVILKLINNTVIENGSTVKVSTENILDSNYKKVEDYTGKYEIFND